MISHSNSLMTSSISLGMWLRNRYGMVETNEMEGDVGRGSCAEDVGVYQIARNS